MNVIALGLSLLVLTGCEDLEEYLKKIQNDIQADDYEAPPGSSASEYFSTTTKALTTDSSAVLEAMSVGIEDQAAANLYAQGLITLTESEETAQVSDDAATILEKIRAAKLAHDPDSYQENSSSDFIKSGSLLDTDFSNDTVTWDVAAGTEISISTLDKMPVRNQGQRGTCASFAAIGQLEGYMLKISTLDSVDLSEQRYYAMSKPEHWGDGGDVNDGGSDYSEGFYKSSFLSSKYSNADSTDPSQYNISNTYNIPLEVKCPYNKSPGDNDIQYPGSKDGDCATGVVQVTDFDGWMYGDNELTTAQDLFDHIKTNDYPAIVGTKLSDNWENNDGVITWADAEGTGSTSHASGHAYLIVGAKKLSETEYPGEGGMCFIIKNSWGKGWGVNGYSCMTLKWFNMHRFNSSFPVVRSAKIDTATLKTQVEEEETVDNEDDITPPDESTKVIDQPKGKPRGTISFGIDPARLLNSYQSAALLDDEDQFKKIRYQILNNQIFIHGILADETTQTHDLELIYDSDTSEISYSFPEKTIVVGKLDSGNQTLTLCAQAYAEKCHFNYVSESNELAIGLTKAEFLRDDSTGPYEWTYLGAAGRGIEFSIPEDYYTRIDIRFNTNGEVTNPLRFRIDPLAGDVSYQGIVVGNYQSGELCSGDYKSVCKMVRTTDKFLIIFRS